MRTRWLGEEVRSVGGSQSSYPRSLSESLLAKLAGACSVPSRKCPRHGGLAQMLDASPKSSACTRSQRVNLQQDWRRTPRARASACRRERNFVHGEGSIYHSTKLIVTAFIYSDTTRIFVVVLDFVAFPPDYLAVDDEKFWLLLNIACT